MQPAFDQLINTVVKPLLKENRFSKKSLNFYKKGDLIWMFNFQKSKGNFGEHVWFFINCGIYLPALDIQLSGKALTEPKDHECHFRERIENITERGLYGGSYYINNDTDLEALSADMASDLQIVIRFFNNIKTEDDLLDLLLTNGRTNNFELFRYFYLKNDVPRMKALVQELYTLFGKESRWSIFERNLKEILAGSMYSLEDLLTK
jgi:hypothetical protein